MCGGEVLLYQAMQRSTSTMQSDDDDEKAVMSH